MIPLSPYGDRRRVCVGLLGGSFNPAHAGHRHISLAALRELGLDEVWWLVTPQNPLKPVAGMAPLAERLASARAVARHLRIRVSGIESRLGTRYTADTLAALIRFFPRARFVWLMGADNLRQIPRWACWTRVFTSVPIAVFPRSPYSLRALGGMAAQRFARARVSQRRARLLPGKKPPAWVFLPLRQHPASSTAIRSSRSMAATPITEQNPSASSNPLR